MKFVMIGLNDVLESGKMVINIQVQNGMSGYDSEMTVNCDELIKLIRDFDKEKARIYSDTIEILEILVYNDSDVKEKLLEMIDSMVGEETKYILE